MLIFFINFPGLTPARYSAQFFASFFEDIKNSVHAGYGIWGRKYGSSCSLYEIGNWIRNEWMNDQWMNEWVNERMKVADTV